jgi:DNA-binding CsgD family transcriptional regulator
MLFSTTEPAFAVNRNGQIMAWNPAAEETFGFTQVEALGQRCWNLFSGRDIFGNRYCCNGCPVHDAAFNHEPVRSFQINFETAAHERERFTVTTLMVFTDSNSEYCVHLCRPERDEIKHTSEQPERVKLNDSLTTRELEILSLLHKGMTVSAIAAKLNVCTSTIRNHNQHIFSKLNVHSRFEAVALGRKLSLI